MYNGTPTLLLSIIIIINVIQNNSSIHCINNGIGSRYKLILIIIGWCLRFILMLLH